ncbi:MAG: hypothetical protein V4736_14905, partial [Bdellovibrionota bacterium]
MNIANFLQFWSQNNTIIIEVLIGVVLFLLIMLSFKFLSSGDAEESNSGLKADELEKMLKNFQATASSMPAAPRTAAQEEAAADAAMDDSVRIMAEKDQALRSLQEKIEKLERE